MILRRLVEYADNRMQLPPPMYGETPIRWLVDLAPDGTPEGFAPLGGDAKANRRGENMLVPTVVRAAGIKPKLLADNGEYVLGVARADTNLEKVEERHRRFVDLVRLCAEQTRDPKVGLVTKFLQAWDEGEHRDLLPEEFDSQDNLTFRVGGTIPASDSPEVQSFWAESTFGDDAPVMTCLVTGEAGPVEQRLPVKVKGLTRIGGQAAGTSLISANAPAFESYGLENSLTSPISRDAGEKFGKALNDLLDSENSRIYAGPLAYVFWTREPSRLDPVGFMDAPDPNKVKNLLSSPYSGEKRNEQGNGFYAIALSASSGRAVIRDWLETTVPEAADQLKRWFRAQEIVDARGEKANPLGLYALAAGAYRDPVKEMTPQVPAALVRAAIRGGRLPEELLARAVRRNRAEGDVSRQRAALMKLVLSYMTGGELSEIPQELNQNSEDKAYNCGRLLAELEALQRAAIPGVKATLVDRFYGSASSAPASVFGTLMRNHQAHIGKLRKERGGAAVAIQDRISEITTRIGRDFPKTLTLREQANFALGYYHQRAHNRAQSRQNREEN